MRKTRADDVVRLKITPAEVKGLREFARRAVNRIVKPVKLCGLNFNGKTLEAVCDRRAWPTVDAVVDARMTASVITTTLAKRIGATVITRAKVLRGTSCDGAFVVLQLVGGKPSYHFVVVDDQLMRLEPPWAQMILGHDYLGDHCVKTVGTEGTYPARRSKIAKRR
jgi:hypothetical protein